MSHSVRSIILAAGKGTRMKSSRAKVLHQICGQALIDYVLRASRAVGVEQNYVVVGHNKEQVIEHLPNDCLAVEQRVMDGTGGAVRAVIDHLKDFSGDIIVMCGDTPLLTGEVIQGLLESHRRDQASATVLTTKLQSSDGYGRIIRDQQEHILAIREHVDATDDELKIAEINVGVYCFNAQRLLFGLSDLPLHDDKQEYYLTDIVEWFVKQGESIASFQMMDPLQGMGVNSRHDLSQVDNIMRQRIIDRWLDEGVTIIQPDQVYIADDVVIGQDTVIYPFTVVDSGVRIGAGCQIGPFAHLRSGTTIEDQVWIGNFTEVSRSNIASGAFMKHFSFIGDAQVGANANIGAGTITANFDGQNKHQTKIGKKSFIGSDSVLIAPLEIGDNVVIGAGSVVTKGRIASGEVAYGNPARIKKRKSE